MKNKIKIQRAIKDITQEELAKIIGVNAMEKNKYVPSTVLALKIAYFFSMAVEELFELEETD